MRNFLILPIVVLVATSSLNPVQAGEFSPQLVVKTAGGKLRFKREEK